MMFSKSLIAQASRLLKDCEGQGIMLASAESCTGGLIAALLTEIPGSSSVFERGFVTYSNAAKTSLLGVPAALIKKHGAVSGQVARAMAQGAIKHSKATLSVSVSGIAGPGGGTARKPVGLVYIATALKGKRTQVREWRFEGSRPAIRLRAVEQALRMLRERLDHFS